MDKIAPPVTATERLSQAVLATYERFCPAILSDLMHEVVRAERQHGFIPPTPFHQLAILGEEVGEANEAALDYNRFLREPCDGGETYAEKKHELRRHYREELVQIAAVAIRMVESIDKEFT